MEQLSVRRVLLLYKEMIPSVRLCGHCQLAYLATQGQIEYRHLPVKNIKRKDLEWAEIVLLCRLDDNYERQLTRLMKKARKYVAYIIDDDLLNVPLELSSGAYYARTETQNNIRSMLRMSDAVISPSPLLLEKYAGDQRKGILLEEPAIDPVAYAPHNPEKPIRIGFAGSVDRTGDIDAILRNVLLRLKKEYDRNIEFVFYGASPACAKELNATCISYSASYQEYRQKMNELHLDIGLAPMPDTEFHACKHYNKFVEYSAANTVGVFSNNRPYDRLAEQVGWELLCDNTSDSWYATIKQLLDHPEKLDDLKRKVAILAETKFSIPSIAKELLQSICAVPEEIRVKSVGSVSFCILRVQALIERIINGLKRYGLVGSIAVFRRMINKTGD